jgi:hypothetical protein
MLKGMSRQYFAVCAVRDLFYLNCSELARYITIIRSFQIKWREVLQCVTNHAYNRYETAYFQKAIKRPTILVFTRCRVFSRTCLVRTWKYK